MHIVLRNVRQLVVHHMWQVCDIQTAGSDVSRHQHANIVGFEGRECALTRRLALVAVNCHRTDALLFQICRQLIRTVLRARKHQRLCPVTLHNQLRQEWRLPLVSDHIRLLIDPVCRGIARRHFDFHRIVQHRVCEFLHVGRIRRREEQVLTLGRHQFQNLLNVVDEPHVQHPVRLVQHQYLDARQLYLTALTQIEQAARRGHDDIKPAPHLVNLRLEAHPAENHHRANVHMLPVINNTLVYLRCQFAGGCEHERPWTLAATGSTREDLKQGQTEGSRLTRTRLCATEHIPAVQDRRDRPRLDWRRLGVAFGFHGCNQLGHEPKFREGRHDGLCRLCRGLRRAGRLN